MEGGMASQFVCESIIAAVFVKSLMSCLRDTFVTLLTFRGLHSSENTTAFAEVLLEDVLDVMGELGEIARVRRLLVLASHVRWNVS